MARKRKNELDELLRDAVKFMEWPTGGGPTSARIELPDDFPIDELSMEESEGEEEKSSEAEESSTPSTTEQKEAKRSSKEHKERKRQKREEFYVPEKPLSPDSDVEQPDEEDYSRNRIRSVTTHMNSASHVAAGNISGLSQYNKEAQSKARLNLLSLVQQTSFGGKEASTSGSGASSPKTFSVPVPGARGLVPESELLVPSDQQNNMIAPVVPKAYTFTQPPAAAVATAYAPAGTAPVVNIARHPLLSIIGRRAEHQGTPFIRGFLMGLPSRR
jgi:hypothetical protein